MSVLSNFLPSSIQAAVTTLIAAEPIQQGDVVSVGSDGLAYWANDPALTAYAHPIVLAAPLYTVQTAAPTANNAAVGRRMLQSSAVLSNGNIVIASISGNGGVRCEIFTSTGALVGAPILVDASPVYTTAYPTDGVTVIALSGGGFAVGYINASGAMLAIYSNAGVLAWSGTAIAGAGYMAGNLAIALCQLTNGNIVVVGGTVKVSENPFLQFAILSATGGSVVAATTVSPTTVTALSMVTSVAICVCGTGFLLGWAYKNGGNNTYAYCATYSATGAVVTAPITMQSTPGQLSYSMQAINVNGYATLFYGSGIDASASLAPRAYSFNSAGVQVGSMASFGSAGSAQGFCIAKSGTNVLVCVQSLGTLYCSYFNPSTGTYGTSFTISGAFSSGVTYGLTCCVLTDGSFVFLTALGDVARVNVGAGSLYGSALNVPALAGTWCGSLLAMTAAIAGLAVSNGACWIGFGSNYNVPFCAVVIARSPIGVAQAPAAAGAAASVQITGAIATRLSFAMPYTIDARNNPIIGQRMSVVGTMAILNGIQDARPRNIN